MNLDRKKFENFIAENEDIFWNEINVTVRKVLKKSMVGCLDF